MDAATENAVTGPKVRKLLTQPLDPGESLRLSRDYEIELFASERLGVGFVGNYISVRHAVAIYDRKRGTYKTLAQVAAEMDAWLLTRANGRAEDAARHAAEQAAKRAAADARATLIAEMGEERPCVESVPFRLVFEPNDDGTGWRLGLGTRAEGASTSEVKALIAAIRKAQL